MDLHEHTTCSSHAGTQKSRQSTWRTGGLLHNHQGIERKEPTILLTNQLKASAVQLITRYAQHMIIENGIAEAINFFHLDALTSMVGLKVDFDLQMTLIAGSLYRLMSKKTGREYARATAKTLFRKIFDLAGNVTIDKDTITVQFARKAHNPFLIAAGFTDEQVQVPWLKNKTLNFGLSDGIIYLFVGER